MILTIEDDQNLCAAIAATLEDEGYQVACAPDGAAALRLLRRGPAPALILLDLHMPALTGRGVLEGLGDEPRLRAIPVILMTGADSGETSAVSGVEELLYKPFTPEALLNAIARYVPRRRAPDG